MATTTRIILNSNKIPIHTYIVEILQSTIKHWFMFRRNKNKQNVNPVYITIISSGRYQQKKSETAVIFINHLFRIIKFVGVEPIILSLPRSESSDLSVRSGFCDQWIDCNEAADQHACQGAIATPIRLTRGNTFKKWNTAKTTKICRKSNGSSYVFTNSLSSL